MDSSLAFFMIAFGIGLIAFIFYVVYDIGYDCGYEASVSNFDTIIEAAKDSFNDFEGDTIEDYSGELTGWFIRYSRYNDVLHWGPFKSFEDAEDWLDDKELHGAILPMYLNVDWNR